MSLNAFLILLEVLNQYNLFFVNNMKNQISKIFNSISHKKVVILLFVWLGYSCAPKDIEFRTFEGELIYSYLQKDTSCTQFVKVIDKAGLRGMLSAYGEYTCLAPTNNALKSYYKTLGHGFTFDSLTQGQIDTLVKTHILPGKFLTMDMKIGVIPSPNMINRFIEITFDTLTAKISFNDSSHIVLKDIEVYNGVIQGIDRVIRPSNIQLPGLIKRNLATSIFSEALEITHLSDSISLIEDLVYAESAKNLENEKYMGYSGYTVPLYVPKQKKYGYTAFIETDDVLKNYGINSLADLVRKSKEWYPPRLGEPVVADNDYTSRYNSLNKFIAYHLINKVVNTNNFFYAKNPIKNYVPDEYLETMLRYRIIRVSKINNLVTLNTNSDFTTHIVEGKTKTTVNGLYHILDKVMVYSEGGKSGTVEAMLSNTRIRFDATSLFPEMMNNNIRGAVGGPAKYYSGLDICGMRPGYLSGLKSSKDTRLQYLSSNSGPTYQADAMEFFGSYDLTVRMLPVPPGTYEIRFGYTVYDNRGITQIYVDNKPVGIPLNLAISLTAPGIGAIVDAQTDDNGFENDKMIRNRGYMKGPNTIWYTYNNSTTRDYIASTMGASRRVIGAFAFTEYGPHTLRFKNVTSNLDKLLILDYFEFVPKSVYNRADGEPETRD